MSAHDPKRTFECGYHPVRHLPPMLPRLRFGLDPLESSNETLRGGGHPDFKKKSRLGGWRTELLTQLGTN